MEEAFTVMGPLVHNLFLTLREIGVTFYDLFLNFVFPQIETLIWILLGILFWTVFLYLLMIFIVLLVLPFVFKCSSFLQKEVLFLPYVAHPPKYVFQEPQDLGLCATRNFYVTYRDWSEGKNVSLGVWHVLPNYVVHKFSRELGLKQKEAEAAITTRHHEKHEEAVDTVENEIRKEYPYVNHENDAEFYERMMNIPGAKIILYFHGSTGSRAKFHRIELYDTLRQEGYHVIVFDYRGYADSLPTHISLNEAGVVHDGIAVYNYLISVTKNPIYVWGHSLGTGIAAHVMADIKALGLYEPRALILESPFSNMRDTVKEHPFAIIWKYLPWFDFTIVQAVLNIVRFESDKHLAAFPQPVLILHAEDDYVVPFKCGKQLYEAATTNRPKNCGPIDFYAFRAELGYGHKFITRSPELPDLLFNFFTKYEYVSF